MTGGVAERFAILDGPDQFGLRGQRDWVNPSVSDEGGLPWSA